MTKRIWDDFLTERDKQVYAKAGYGKRGGFGTRPALFIIDVQYNFCGDKPEDILEGLKQYRTHCGAEAWAAVEHIVPLLHLAREKNIPVFYTESARRPDLIDSGVQVGKNHRGTERTVLEGTHATQTVCALGATPAGHPHRQAQAVMLLRHHLHEPPELLRCRHAYSDRLHHLGLSARDGC